MVKVVRGKLAGCSQWDVPLILRYNHVNFLCQCICTGLIGKIFNTLCHTRAEQGFEDHPQCRVLYFSCLIEVIF